MNASASHKKKKGFVAIEVALLSPLVLMFFMIIIEFGFFFFYRYQLQEASYRGARYAASHYVSNPSEVQNNTQLVAVYGIPDSRGKPLLPGLQKSNVNVSEPDASDGYITVQVKYDYPIIFPILSLLKLDIGKQLHAQTIMRVL